MAALRRILQRRLDKAEGEKLWMGGPRRNFVRQQRGGCVLGPLEPTHTHTHTFKHAKAPRRPSSRSLCCEIPPAATVVPAIIHKASCSHLHTSVFARGPVIKILLFLHFLLYITMHLNIFQNNLP